MSRQRASQTEAYSWSAYGTIAILNQQTINVGLYSPEDTIGLDNTLQAFLKTNTVDLLTDICHVNIP